MNRLRVAATAGLAWVGVIVGHLVAYVVAHPDEEARNAHLILTGHGSFRIAVLSLIGVVPAVLALAAIRALRTDTRPEIRRTALWLAAIQLPAFALLELLERGMSFRDFSLDPVAIVGLAVQILVALLSSVLLAAFFRGVQVLAKRLRAVRPLRVPVTLSSVVDGPPSRLVFLIRARRRAPPLLLAA